jgi:hypothetical protein
VELTSQMQFDESTVLRVEMAHKNMFLKVGGRARVWGRGRAGGGLAPQTTVDGVLCRATPSSGCTACACTSTKSPAGYPALRGPALLASARRQHFIIWWFVEARPLSCRGPCALQDDPSIKRAGPGGLGRLTAAGAMQAMQVRVGVHV